MRGIGGEGFFFLILGYCRGIARVLLFGVCREEGIRGFEFNLIF